MFYFRLNSKETYSLNYIHRYNGQTIESIILLEDEIEHTTTKDSTVEYVIYDLNGDFKEIGYFRKDNEKPDSIYIVVYDF